MSGVPGLRKLVEDAVFQSSFVKERVRFHAAYMAAFPALKLCMGPHGVEESIMLTCMQNTMARNGLRERLTTDLSNLGLTQFYVAQHGKHETEERFIDLITFSPPPKEIVSFARACFKVIQIPPQLLVEWQKLIANGFFRSGTNRRWKLDNVSVAPQDLPDIIYERKQRHASAHVLRMDIGPCDHMQDQLYVQLRLNARFRLTHRKTGEKTSVVKTLTIINVAFVGPRDAWAPLATHTRIVQNNGHRLRSLTLHGMTFYALAFFKDIAATEKLHIAPFFAVMAYLETRAPRVGLATLRAWDIFGGAHPDSFLQSVSTRVIDVRDQLKSVSPTKSAAFVRDTKRVYDVTLTTLEAAFQVDKVGFVLPTFVTSTSIQ